MEKKIKNVNDWLRGFVYYNKNLVMVQMYVLAVFVFLYVIFGVPIVKRLFGEENIYNVSYIVLTTVTLLVLLIFGVVGKMIFKNRSVKCEKCGTVSTGDITFCPECRTRVGWDDWGIKK